MQSFRCQRVGIDEANREVLPAVREGLGDDGERVAASSNARRSGARSAACKSGKGRRDGEQQQCTHLDRNSSVATLPAYLWMYFAPPG
jgi:hypothetical protein